MRDLLHRLGCLVQLGVGAVAAASIWGRTPLPSWGEAAAVVAVSFVGTWLVQVVGAGVLDGLE